MSALWYLILIPFGIHNILFWVWSDEPDTTLKVICFTSFCFTTLVVSVIFFVPTNASEQGLHQIKIVWMVMCVIAIALYSVNETGSWMAGRETASGWQRIFHKLRADPSNSNLLWIHWTGCVILIPFLFRDNLLFLLVSWSMTAVVYGVGVKAYIDPVPQTCVKYMGSTIFLLFTLASNYIYELTDRIRQHRKVTVSMKLAAIRKNLRHASADVRADIARFMSPSTPDTDDTFIDTVSVAEDMLEFLDYSQQLLDQVLCNELSDAVVTRIQKIKSTLGRCSKILTTSSETSGGGIDLDNFTVDQTEDFRAQWQRYIYDFSKDYITQTWGFQLPLESTISLMAKTPIFERPGPKGGFTRDIVYDVFTLSKGVPNVVVDMVSAFIWPDAEKIHCSRESLTNTLTLIQELHFPNPFYDISRSLDILHKAIWAMRITALWTTLSPTVRVAVTLALSAAYMCNNGWEDEVYSKVQNRMCLVHMTAFSYGRRFTASALQKILTYERCQVFGTVLSTEIRKLLCQVSLYLDPRTLGIFLSRFKVRQKDSEFNHLLNPQDRGLALEMSVRLGSIGGHFSVTADAWSIQAREFIRQRLALAAVLKPLGRPYQSLDFIVNELETWRRGFTLPLITMLLRITAAEHVEYMLRWRREVVTHSWLEVLKPHHADTTLTSHGIETGALDAKGHLLRVRHVWLTIMESSSVSMLYHRLHRLSKQHPEWGLFTVTESPLEKKSSRRWSSNLRRVKPAATM
eukprot:Blabericola_migrator_1__356@NODE_108_length_14046_cov_203_246656_g96_i0_p3_GENE_NODE_108_length_14046_cov_203_246656_g96_i0NODE_108_length_14046_cov_203_246656_g96_i0_p3_ORF_typecomplete_len744_score109_19YrhC/PF14143_6/1_1YrhC/PF14143_6/4_6e03Polysacc_synt/PF01943_17/5_8Polysacc_synt/PF01943_17/1e03YqjK/PF13997_6/1_2e03YqjK/PF13997_6/9_6e03YqjK/PF13997_6/0_3_NODE_108_length_14046_cov_203_246656_g96_i014573688